MARVFLSFLGVGKKDVGYIRTRYRYGDGYLPATRFVQRATLEAFGASTFDRVLVLVTPTSARQTYPDLEAELAEIGVRPPILSPLGISETLDARDQWAWFDEVLRSVDPGDSLVIDMTHGFRVVPIVLSSALGYLRRVKNVRLEAVLYGAEDGNAGSEDPTGRLVDMSSFYVIQDWADAVSRLVDSADARSLAELAASATEGSFAGLRSDELVDALKHLTDVLKNVEVNAVEEAVRSALDLLERQRAQARTEAEGQLLGLVIDKFTSLLLTEPSDGRYTREYLTLQVRVARLLAEHGLFMQCFTVMRELIGSMGIYGLGSSKYGSAKRESSEGFRYRGRFAEAFLAMLQFDEPSWKFEGQRAQDVETLRPWYRKVVAESEQASTLRRVVKELVHIRNGFDHAWTAKRLTNVLPRGDQPGRGDLVEALQARAMSIAKELEDLIRQLPEPPA